jgi:hypothetical protein
MARPKFYDLTGFGMQYGVATCHLAFRGRSWDQAFGTDRGMQEDCFSQKWIAKEAGEHLMSLISCLLRTLRLT